MGKYVQPLQSVKTSILTELTVRSGLGDIYIKGDKSCVLNMLIIYCLMVYIIYVTLIMRLWELYNLVAILVELDMDSLLLFSPHFRRCFRLVINQSVGSCREKLIPKVWSCLSVVAIKGCIFYTKYVIIYALSFDITPYL